MTSKTTSLLPVLAVLALAPAPARAELTPTQRVRGAAEDRARGEIGDLFRTLCPEQCVLLGVTARVEEEAVGQGDPGFETLAGARAPVLRGVAASVVVDGRLPAAFRTRVKTLVSQRLAALGAPVTVDVDRVNFPVRNPTHLEAPPPEPRAEPALAATPERTREERIADRLADAAPTLAIVALLALALVVLGFLLYLATRRSADAALAWASEPAAEPAAAAPQAQAPRAELFPAARGRRLAKTLSDERAVRNAVVREALAAGEAPLVARWVRELGDFLLDDLRGDATAGGALDGLAAELVRHDRADAGARAEALHVLEGRVAAARLARASESADDAFAFLEGVRPDLFVAACEGISAGALEVALRFAPQRLRTAALEALPPGRREEVALAWAARPEVRTEYALAAAEELRERVARTSGGALQAERVLSDLLDGMTRDEQDALVARLGAHGGTRAGAPLTESALLAAPAEVLLAAIPSVPAERLLAYLAGADEDVRARVLGACPARVRAELEEELGLGRASTRAEFVAARRELLGAVRDEAARRGLALAAARPPPRARVVEG